MRDLGDFQTPPALVAAVLERIGPVGLRWSRVLEPTCGRGHFVAGLLALDRPPREIIGLELQAGHLAEARASTQGVSSETRVDLIHGDLFTLDLRQALRWREEGPLLVVGNPPWVTNAELGAMESGNRPHRSNIKAARGIEAVTGASNFDIAESIWLKLIEELAPVSPTIALLCKLTVARNVLEHAARLGISIACAEVARVDARAWFHASVEACLFVLTLGPRDQIHGQPIQVPLYASLETLTPQSAMGFAHGRIVSDMAAYAAVAHADGVCPRVWRQGVKHDAAGVMELRADATGRLTNRAGDVVDVESSRVFPLMKGSDLARAGRARPSRSVIVTQRTTGDDTSTIQQDAPRLWDYLNANRAAFTRRKSSIYRSRPDFAMFGVGPYCFAPYKVCVSGLHAARRFHAVGPIQGRPIMLDDTGYFLACSTPEQAALIAAVCNTDESRALLRALALDGAKRPVTKGLLQRLDLRALLNAADPARVLAEASADVEYLAGRSPQWPAFLDHLLASDDPNPRETPESWPSPRSTISASR